MEKDWISTHEAARVLGITRSGFYHHIEAQSFPQRRNHRGEWEVLRSAVEQYRDERRKSEGG